MDPVQWLESKKQYFSQEMNGYPRPPRGPYISTLPLIDRDGKIMDLGCGNGMLLAFLMKFSGHELEPYGIDCKPKPIGQARGEILPEYERNFRVAHISEYDYAEGPFDIIIANPFHVDLGIDAFTQRCLSHLIQGGRLVYRIHDDVLRGNKIKTVQEVGGWQFMNMRVSRGEGLELCVFDK